MDALKVSFVNGESMVFAFGPDSTLSIETPDGVNGVQRGVVSEVVGVEYVKGGAGAPVEEPAAVVEEPVRYDQQADASAEVSQVDEPASPAAPAADAPNAEPDATPEPAAADAPEA